MGLDLLTSDEGIFFSENEKKAIIWSLKLLAESDGIKSNKKSDTLAQFFRLLNFEVSNASLMELSEMEESEGYAILKGMTLNKKFLVKKMLEGFALSDGAMNKMEKLKLEEIESFCEL